MKISLSVALKLWWSMFWRHFCYSMVLGGILGIVIAVAGFASLTHAVLGSAHSSTTTAAPPALSAQPAAVTAVPPGVMLALIGGYSLFLLLSAGLGVLAVKNAVPKHLKAMVDSVNANR
jgi:hypothetical protein